MEKIKSLPEKYIALAVLIIWGAIFLLAGLIRVDPFGLDEGAARALILNWSISDNIVNPIFILGAPDFRAILFAPIGIYWSGSMLAAKIFSLVISFLAAWLLYRWSRRTDNSETALLATALFLISPFIVGQIDSMGAAPYLLLAFALGAWLDNAYRKTEKYFGAWYFLQLLWIAIVVSLHPTGLAYPAALAYRWYKQPHEHKTSRHVFIGIFLAVFFSLAITWGWHDLQWFSNPFAALSLAVQGGIVISAEQINWVPGIIAAFILGVIFVLDKETMGKDFLGSIFMLAILIGVIAADQVWASLVYTFVIYRAVALLNNWNQQRESTSYIGQKGGLIIVAFVTATFFMIQAKTHALDIKYERLSQEDELILTLANIARDKDKPFRAASQWPGRTMIATRRDVLPLPPAFSDGDELYEKAISQLTHILFNPYDKDNQQLAKNMAMLVSQTTTLELNRSGALVAVTKNDVKLHSRPNQELQKEQSPQDANKE